MRLAIVIKSREEAKAKASLRARVPLDYRPPTQEELEKQKELAKKLHWYVTDERKDGESDQVRAQFALTEEQRQEYLSYMEETQKDVRRCLIFPDKKDRLFSLLALHGPRILAADPLRPGPLLLLLESYWLKPRLVLQQRGLKPSRDDDLFAGTLLKVLGDAFSFVGYGPPLKKKEEKKDPKVVSRESTGKSRRAERKELASLLQEYEKNPTRGITHYQKALTSSAAPTQNAAKRFQKKMLKKLR